MITAVSDPQRVLDAWTAMANRTDLPRIRMVTPARRAALKSRLKDAGVDALLEAIARVEASAFCRGGNDRGWRADFDFILQPKSLVKLLEGAYSGEPPATNGALALSERLSRMADEGPVLEGSVQPDLLEGPARG